MSAINFPVSLSRAGPLEDGWNMKGRHRALLSVAAKATVLEAPAGQSVGARGGSRPWPWVGGEGHSSSSDVCRYADRAKLTCLHLLWGVGWAQ